MPQPDIPRKLHYCWFGGKPIPEAYQTYMDSWRRQLPDFELVRWDESSFDMDACPYFRQAYENRYWAFASDYARFRILYEQGGVYLDTDVEVLRPLDDLLERGAFLSLEYDLWGDYQVNPGLGMAFPAGHPLLREILDYYESRDFIVDGEADTAHNVCVNTTSVLLPHGLDPKRNEIQTLDGVTVYPTEYLCPIDFFTHEQKVTGNTCTIHHYAYTWGSERDARNHRQIRTFIRLFGRRAGPRLWHTASLPRLAVGRIRKRFNTGCGKI